MKRVTVIDLDSIIYVVAYKNQDERLSSIVAEATRNWIDTILTKTEAEGYVGFYQIQEHKNYRKIFYPGYKSKRPPTPDFVKKWRTVITDVFDSYQGIIGLKIIESDDALAIWGTKYKETYELTFARIDKDLDCIPGRHYHYKAETFKDITEEEANFFAKCQVLAGDSGDTIPGVPGIGMKKAEKFVQEHNSVVKAYKAAAKVKKVDTWIRNFYRDYHSVHLLTSLDKLKKHTKEEEVDIFAPDFGDYEEDTVAEMMNW